MHEIDSNSKPQRAQGGKGLLSRSIHVQEYQKSMPKTSTPREEKGGGREGDRERGGARRRRVRAVLVAGTGRERGLRGGVFMVPTQGSKIPLDLD